MYHVFSFDFISGMSIGVELFFRDDLVDPDDNFAIDIDLGILRLSYLNTDSDEFDGGKECHV